MKLGYLNKVRPDITYLGKVSLITLAYYVSAEVTVNYFTFSQIFNHQDYTIFWPPSGIALGFVLIWGRSIWPGIFIASTLLTLFAPWFQHLTAGPGITALSVIFFAVGRVLEALAAQFLLKRVNFLNEPFKVVKSTFYFILISLTVATISSAAGGLSTHLIRSDTTEVMMARTFGWYVGNAIGILIFTPFMCAVYHQLVKKETIRSFSLLPITLIIGSVFLAIYLTETSAPTVHRLLEDSVGFFVLPFLIAVAFRSNLLVTSVTVILISFITKFITETNHGPFLISNELYNTVILLQAFLFVISITALIFHATANERRDNLIKLKEAKSRAEESDRLKSSFLANMSHEIRTPMNAVMGFAELLQRPNLSQARYEEFSYLIRQRSKDLLAIVNDVLDISKIESGHMESRTTAGNIQELLNQAMKNLTGEINHLNKKTIEVTAYNDLKGTENMVMADFPRLQQVLNNLLNNALKFTSNGFIEFGCRFHDNDTLLFYVKDTGIGIDPSQHDLIFKPFHQVSPGSPQQYHGTGLGLAIVKGLLGMWNGKIWVESSLGNGTTFFFTIPYVPQDKMTVVEQAGNAQVPWEKVSILLVEDDIFSASYLKEILNNFPCQVMHVESGGRALGAVRKEKPSLVLMDLGLPDMEGLEVIEQMKKMHPDLIIAVVTAFATSDHKAKALGLGCSTFLSKPLSPETLIKTITNLLQNEKNK